MSFTSGEHRSLSQKLVDFLALTVLILFAAVPLIILRGSTLLSNVQIVSAIVIIWLSVALLWVYYSPKPQAVLERPAIRVDGVILIMLLLLCIVAFALPMREHYWSAMDEPLLFATREFWTSHYDLIASRPLGSVAVYIANLMTPSDISGFFIMAIVLRWLTAVFLYQIMSSLVPKARLLAVVAAILFIVNPSEKLRFFPAFILPYYGAVFFLTASFSVFLQSYLRASRRGLLLACVLLGISLLHYETGFPIALLGWGILRLRERRPHISTWCWAWYGTIGMLALRYFAFFVSVYLHSKNNYQSLYISKKLISWENIQQMFGHNLIELLSPILRFLSPLNMLQPWTGGFAAVGAAIVGVLTVLLIARMVKWENPSSKLMLGGAAFACLALLLTVLPELHIPIAQANWPYFRDDQTLRLEFFSAPVQAVIWALAIGLVAYWIPARFRMVWIACSTGLLTGIAVVAAFQLQAIGGAINPTVDFKKESRIWNEVARLMPPLQKESVLFFDIPGDLPSPFGWGHHVYYMSCLLFGVPGYQGHHSSKEGFQHSRFGYPEPANEKNYVSLNLQDPVIFAISPDGSVTLEKSLDLPVPHFAAVNSTTCPIQRVAYSGEHLPYLSNSN